MSGLELRLLPSMGWKPVLPLDLLSISALRLNLEEAGHFSWTKAKENNGGCQPPDPAEQPRPPLALQMATQLAEVYFVESVPIMWAFSSSRSGVSCYFLEWVRKRLRGTGDDRQYLKETAVNPKVNLTPWEHWEPKLSVVYGGQDVRMGTLPARCIRLHEGSFCRVKQVLKVLHMWNLGQKWAEW